MWSRAEPGPAFDVPISGDHGSAGRDRRGAQVRPRGAARRALDRMAQVSPLPREVLETRLLDAVAHFHRPGLEAQINNELGGADVLDGWREVPLPDGRVAATRAFPPRLVHIMAGNAPGVAAMSIVRGALTKGVNLLKLPSNDLFTATAILRTMAADRTRASGRAFVLRGLLARRRRDGRERAVPPAVLRQTRRLGRRGDHPGRAEVRRSRIRARLLRPQDVHLGDRARGVRRPRRALAEAAEARGHRRHVLQPAGLRRQPVPVRRGLREPTPTGSRPLLCDRLGVARQFSSAGGPKVAGELREEIDVLRSLAPDYRVWGGYDGAGLVIRSPEPVDFHPDGKIVNVVPVAEPSRTSSASPTSPPRRSASIRQLARRRSATRSPAPACSAW